jgi:hypothetical protein
MYDLVAGDTGSVIQITCIDKATQQALDLTGSTVDIHWEDSTGTLVSHQMQIVSAINGQVKYQFGVNELFAPSMSFEIVVTNASGKTLSNTTLLNVNVRDKLA